tara:strand:- start:2247 stop:2669 length:423 start_codon:yes stop_codon:yes gene_type:complete
MQSKMKKLLLTALLCFCVNAYAFNWVETATSYDGSRTTYADTSSIKKVGDLIYVWELQDYLEPKTMLDGRTISSMVTKKKVGCDELKAMAIVYEGYSSNMGRGTLVDSFSSKQASGETWVHHKPETMGEVFVKFVCNLAK